MATVKYTPASLRELDKLVKLAAIREAEYKLGESSKIVKKWANRNIQTNEAFEKMSDLFYRASSIWSDKADPGIPVAHAVVKGYIGKEDISSETWDKIEMLITISKI